MLKIEEYMLLSKAERQSHLRLNEACVERGGHYEVSGYSRGLLAYILDTTVPLGKVAMCCHACNNGKCGNPYHLYWGTFKENLDDAIACGSNDNKSVWERTVAKYGEREAREMNRRKAVSMNLIKFAQSNRRRSKINWPPIEVLVEMVKNSSNVQVGKQLGVSDVAVSNHLEKFRASRQEDEATCFSVRES